MKLAVSHDDHGDIVTLFNPDQLHGSAGSLQYVPGPGEKHYVLDVPKAFEGRRLEDLAKLLHVATSGGKPRLEPKA